MDNKPTEIDAAQFVSEGYAEKVAKGECEVRATLYPKETVSLIERIKPNSAGWDVAVTDTKSKYRTCSKATFTVRWLQPAPEPAQAGGAGEAEPPMHEWEAKGREYEKAFQVIRDHIDMNQSIAPAVIAINYLQKELSDLLSADMVRDETYNAIWDIVRPDPETWDYPPQITRYVRYQAEELATLRTALAASESRLRQAEAALKPFAAQMKFFEVLAKEQGRHQPTHLMDSNLRSFQHTSLQKATNPIGVLRVKDFAAAAAALARESEER